MNKFCSILVYFAHEDIETQFDLPYRILIQTLSCKLLVDGRAMDNYGNLVPDLDNLWITYG